MHELTKFALRVSKSYQLNQHLLQENLLRSYSLNHSLFSKPFQGEEGRVSEKSGEIATTGRIRKPRTGDGRGRGKGNERGSQVNEKTLITGTKQSTGIAGVTTQTWCGLKMTLYSSAWDIHLLSPSQSSFPEVARPHPLSVPSTPVCGGVAATCTI